MAARKAAIEAPTILTLDDAPLVTFGRVAPSVCSDASCRIKPVPTFANDVLSPAPAFRPGHRDNRARYFLPGGRPAFVDTAAMPSAPLTHGERGAPGHFSVSFSSMRRLRRISASAKPLTSG